MSAIRSPAIVPFLSPNQVALLAGLGISLSYDKATNSYTISAIGGGSGKVYEPAVIEGFNNNIQYVSGEPKVPDFVTTMAGDVVMAWGGDYAS